MQVPPSLSSPSSARAQAVSAKSVAPTPKHAAKPSTSAAPLAAPADSDAVSPVAPPPAASSPAAFDLQRCSVQEYLSHTIYPALAPTLELLDRVRPDDPVAYLAVMLHKEAASAAQRVQQLNEIHTIREQLRAQFTKEYSVEGRV